VRSLRDFGECHAVSEVVELADEVVAPLVVSPWTTDIVIAFHRLRIALPG
jgi:hypothetical protein